MGRDYPGFLSPHSDSSVCAIIQLPVDGPVELDNWCSVSTLAQHAELVQLGEGIDASSVGARRAVPLMANKILDTWQVSFIFAPQ